MSSLLATHIFLGITLLLGAEPKERIWTSADGRKITATLIREVDGDVSLLREGKLFTLPLERLSAADQQYVRDLAAGKEPAEAPVAADPENPFALPEEKNPAPKPAAADNPFALPEEKSPAANAPASPVQPAEEKPAPALPLGKAKKAAAQDRGWTDRSGQSITARFVRMNGGNVVLMRGKVVLNVPFYNLSPVDQQYVRDYLVARGLADQIPAPPLDGLAGGLQPGFPQQPIAPPAAGFPAFPQPPPIPTSPTPPPPSNSMAEMLAKMQADRDRRAEEQRQRDEQRRADDEARTAAAKAAADQRALDLETARQNALAERAAREAERLANNPPAPSGSPGAPGFPRLPTSGSPFSNISVTEYRCSNCNQVVPDDDSVNKCPHCGITFQYKEDPNGIKTRLTGGRGLSSGNSGRLIILLALGAVFVIGAPIAFIAFLVKILSSKPPPPPQAFGQRQYY